MSRRLPRSFFWMDQHLIRSGIWSKLSVPARMAYLALVASCDRDGVTIWSRSKLMEIAGCRDPDDWQAQVLELNEVKLIELLVESSPLAIQVISLSPQSQDGELMPKKIAPSSTSTLPTSSSPIVVHTSIHFGAQAPHVNPATSD